MSQQGGGSSLCQISRSSSGSRYFYEALVVGIKFGLLEERNLGLREVVES